LAERGEVLAGPAGAAWRLFSGEAGGALADDASFAVLHGLYWLAVNLAVSRPLLIAVDDAHWADESSLRWLAYMTARVEGLAVGLLVTVRPGEPAYEEPPLLTVRREATAVVRPRLLTQAAVTAIVRDRAGGAVSEEVCAAVKLVSGGNPFYVREAVRAAELEHGGLAGVDPDAVGLGGAEAVRRHVTVRVRGLGPEALSLAHAVAVLGDGCELRHAAAVAGVEVEAALGLAAGLVRLEVLESDDPPRFLHPIVREAVEASLESDERDRAHRLAAGLLFEDGASPGRVAAHLLVLRPAGDVWVLARLREAARAAIENGAPRAAAELMARALAEPPPPEQRVECLREAARAEATAGRETACALLEQALSLTSDPRERAEIALELANVYAELFLPVEAFDVLERALGELGDADEALAARLESASVVAGLWNPRRASRVAPVLVRLASRPPAGPAAEAFEAGRGLAMAFAGRPAGEIAPLLERALARAEPRAENWTTRRMLLWMLVLVESLDAVEAALEPMLAEVHRSGSASGLVAAHSTLGFLKLRLGALPEADAATRVALRVTREGDFAPGLPLAATILADVAIEAGELDEAQELLALLPQEGWLPGLATVLIPAARGRLRLAQGRAAEALSEFEACTAMFSPEVWGVEVHDNVAYLIARPGAALALLALGERDRARALAQAELDDMRAAGTPRALGIASRVAGLAEGGLRGLELLRESVAVLEGPSALLERAHSLGELGAALRRAGSRADAREPLAEALELAARCGARPLAARVREELGALGVRPRREWRTGVEALTPGELRVARLAAEGQTNREIAQTLYVTLKTVEGHLARAYAKLGIAGRAGLTDALAEEKTRVATP
ncbi:MAG TPA: LuxR C-terminal-related transcriptional regulator, partial [Solirubrobacteraceae bacterium]|nr:LuxR C-terminal-related transcriptional regulator [Solirubrobacteraceae bacterium]